MKKLCLLLFFLSCIPCMGQSIEEKIISFFNEIYDENINPEEIGLKYIWFDSQNKLPIADRNKTFAEQIKQMRKKQCGNCKECQNCRFDFKDSSYEIKKLSDVNIAHAQFTDNSNIYVVISKNEILQYIAIKEEKIAGFYLIKSNSDKEKNSMFLGY